MMGRSHALSGAAIWVAGCALSTYAHRAGVPLAPRPGPGEVLSGALLCAGAALLPDLDHHNSHATRSLVPVTWLLHKALAKTSAVVYRATRTALDDPRDEGTHRRMTHTWPFALLVGALVGFLVERIGPPAGVVAMFVCASWAGRALLPSSARRRLSWRCPRGGRWLLPRELEVLEYGPGLIGVLATGAALGAWDQSGLAAVTWSWWVGVPIAVGSYLHCLGDALTESGCPLAWPVAVRGCRWHDAGMPMVLRFHTGTGPEYGVFASLALLLCCSAYALTAS